MKNTGKLDKFWKVIAWLLRILLVLLVTSAVLLPLIFFAQADKQRQPLTVPIEVGNTWLLLVRTLAWLFLLYVTWRMIRALLVYPLGSWQVFGSTTSARLVALGITTLLVPKSVTALVMLPVNLLLPLADRISHLPMRVGLTESDTSNATYSLREPIFQLSIIVQGTIGELGGAVSKAIGAIPIPETVLGLACWAILGNLMSIAMTPASPAQAGPNRLMSFLVSLSSPQRYAIVLIVVFLFGAYLSIAAIVAIPWLHEEHVPPTLTRENLDKVLTGILPTVEQLGGHIRIPVAEEKPMLPLAKYLASTSAPVGVSTPYIKNTLEAAIAEAENARATGIAQAQKMLADVAQQVSRTKQVALGAFDLETGSPMSAQERSFFIREIQRSVTEDITTMESILDNCAEALTDTDKRLRNLAQIAINLLMAQASQGPQAQGGTDIREQFLFLQISELSSQISNVSVSVRESCDRQITRTSVYVPPDPGSGWGPFGLVARWLLRTKSFALTLITGMLGFGLLGSVISTFVRSGAGKTNVSLTSEIISVLVRGLSAAVVVFLAVKGGLAVFSNTDTEPNAYVVFFTCLIGAVFSEDVWNWAHGKFLGNLNAQAASTDASKSMADKINERLAPKDKKPNE